MAEKVDVLVVGGGSSAYSAAVSAREAGAERVVLVDKARRDEAGGNCRFSLMAFRFAHDGTDDVLSLFPAEARREHDRAHLDPYTTADFAGDLNDVTQGRIDPELRDILVGESRDAMSWLSGHGHTWRFRDPIDTGDRIHYNPGSALCPVDGGTGLMRRWLAVGESLGLELRSESRVTALNGDFRSIRGVRVDGPDGEYDIEAGAVVLASGGFQASAERRGRYFPVNGDLMKVRGSRHNTGEVLEMAIALGAKTTGHWQGGHASPVDAAAPDVEMKNTVNRYAYPFGITVDANAQRFFDEGEKHRTYTYAKTGWTILRQSGGVAYQIYDQQCVVNFPEAYNSATPVQADTIRELAAKIGLSPDALDQTVLEFNAAVDEATPFDATREDKRGARGLLVTKTNWARALVKPPFLAYKVTAGCTFSFGGVKIDQSTRVVNTSGDPIEGLYANGDVVGLFYHNYPSGSGMIRNAVFGRRAGQAAAVHAQK